MHFIFHFRIQKLGRTFNCRIVFLIANNVMLIDTDAAGVSNKAGNSQASRVYIGWRKVQSYYHDFLKQNSPSHTKDVLKLFVVDRKDSISTFKTRHQNQKNNRSPSSFHVYSNVILTQLTNYPFWMVELFALYTTLCNWTRKWTPIYKYSYWYSNRNINPMHNLQLSSVAYHKKWHNFRN